MAVCGVLGNCRLRRSRYVDFGGGDIYCDTLRLYLNLRMKLVKCCSWKVNQKYFESCEMWSWMVGEDQLDRTCEK